jgi:hypothetical protein
MEDNIRSRGKSSNRCHGAQNLITSPHVVTKNNSENYPSSRHALCYNDLRLNTNKMYEHRQ